MHPAIQLQRRRTGAGAQAVHRSQTDAAIGAAAVVVQLQAFAQLRGERLAVQPGDGGEVDVLVVLPQRRLDRGREDRLRQLVAVGGNRLSRGLTLEGLTQQDQDDNSPA